MTTTAPLDLASIRRAPKVLLHDHLDGGLRPATVLALARETGYEGLPADTEQFKSRTTQLGAMYSKYEALPGVFVNGDLTMGENIGDLGGLLIALDAYHLSLDGKPAPVIDGFTGDQRFFLGFAQIWRAKYRDDAIKQQVVSDPHSPAYFRAYGTVRNVDAWYDAFNVKDTDPMYVKPSDRVRIW